MADLVTPRQAAKLLGVSESTVRRWCDAEMVATTRTTGGHRRIHRRALLAFARDRGMEVLDTAPLTTAGRGGRLPGPGELSARFYEHLVGHGDTELRQLAVGIVERTGDSAGLCDDIIAPAMHRVGEDWSTGRLRIFREHAATQRVTAAISDLARQVSALEPEAPIAICAALSGDPYALPPAMCGLVLSSVGYRVTGLGPNTPAAEILEAAVELSATLIAVSISTEPSSSDELESLCVRANEHDVRVALGGRLLTAELRRQLEPDFFGDTMAHLASYAKRLIQSAPSR